MKLVAATGNAHKLQEIRAILKDFTVISEKEAGFSGDVEETGETFLENALIKARAVCEGTGLAAIADDSGICVEALSGAPGVHSARYAMFSVASSALTPKFFASVSSMRRLISDLLIPAINPPIYYAERTAPRL